MKATICNFCKKPIEDDVDIYEMEIGTVNQIKDGVQLKADVCPICYVSPIILSEMRRTRTRKVAPKVGRLRGKKNKPEQPPTTGTGPITLPAGTGHISQSNS